MQLWRIPVCILAAACALAAATDISAAEFSPLLDRELSKATSGDFVSAIVILESPIDIRALDERLHVEKASKLKRHTDVLAALHYNAESTQPKIRAEFDQAISNGVMQGYTAYWIENCFVIHAAKSFIEGLRTRGDIRYVTENFRAELIEPVRRERAERNPLDSRTMASGIVATGALRVNEELGITGSGVLIGDCDTGADRNHPALGARWRGNFAPWWQCWKDNVNHSSQAPSDGNGHGTHTLGTMTGRAVSGADTTWVGCAPNARWIANNAISMNVGRTLDNEILASYQWFVDPDTVNHSLDAVPDVINNSWGTYANIGGDPVYTQCYTFWNTAILNAEAAGIVVIFAAGNEGASGLRSPAIYSLNELQIFSVAADSVDGHTPPYALAGFSSTGPTPCTPAIPNNIKPEISAPGVHVYSSLPGSSYGYLDGTSMATPHVSGIVALMREACPNCDPATIKQALINTAIRTGYVTPPATENNRFGNGFIDAYAAVVSVMGNMGRVMGTIRDASTSAPVQATVQVVGGVQSTLSSAAGSYSLVLPGDSTYTLRYSLYGYATHDLTVHVVTDDTTLQDVSLVPRTVVTLLAEDFETGATGWTHTTPGGQWVDQWNLTTQRAHSATHAYKCGDTGTGNYANYNDARLTSPVITGLPAEARLHFWQQIEAEVSAAFPDSAYDGGILEVSANGGAFMQISPLSPYPKTFRWQRGGGGPATGPMLGQPCFSGSVTAWTEVEADLSAFAGQAIQLRFRFGSDQSSGMAGWFVDDVLVTAFGPNNLTAPESVVIFVDGTDVILRWAADGSPAYRVYSDTDPAGTFATLVGTTATPTLTLTGGAASPAKTFYIVRGWNGQP
ncbi:MAG TPA: S8 family serine peptidase [bacterium]|jgi:bacillopeptidase F